MVDDFTTVTETPGNKASRMQLSMLYTRYRFAAKFCANKKVLEVACGAGVGLGYIQRVAASVVGGDFTGNLLLQARSHYGAQLPLVRLDAHELPFSPCSFDVIILYEAIYYLKDPSLFLAECRRILQRGGLILVCTVNTEWTDFNPSPFSLRYYSAEELVRLLRHHDFDTELYHAFPTKSDSGLASFISVLKRVAVRLHMVPGTMKGKEFLKRIFFGRLSPIPPEMADGVADYSSPATVQPDSDMSSHKVLYAVAHAESHNTPESTHDS